MKTATELRRQVESALAGRIPAALSMRSAAVTELVSCGVREVDAVLGGGFPLAAITELTGMDSSGRTTLALSTLAEVTQGGESCAYVDVSDGLDPLSAAAVGVDLRRLLWVRAGGMDADAATPTALIAQSWVAKNAARNAVRNQATQNQVAQKPVGQEKPQQRNGGGWCHPRSEALGLDHAIGELFQGPQGNLHHCSGELPDFTPRCSESIRRPRPQPVSFQPEREPEVDCNLASGVRHQPGKPWPRLDQSLRAADLLLNAGGFRAIVLDMGDIDAEHARRVPLAMWYRFRLQAEKSQTLFLLLTRAPCAQSCAAVSLCCEGVKANWHQAADGSPALLAGLSYGVWIMRNRTQGAAREVTRGVIKNPALESYGKKPAASARDPRHPLQHPLQPSRAIWSSTTLWLG